MASMISEALNAPACYLFTEYNELTVLLVALHRVPASVQQKFKSLLRVVLYRSIPRYTAIVSWRPDPGPLRSISISALLASCRAAALRRMSISGWFE